MNKFIESANLLREGEKNVDMLRHKRKKLFKAFDIYKTNVNYGLLTETSEQHDLLVKWYNACLDLNEEAIFNAPTEVVKYL